MDSGDHSVVEPPVPIPNTEVKHCSADGSVAKGYVRVGRCQFNSLYFYIMRKNTQSLQGVGFFCLNTYQELACLNTYQELACLILYFGFKILLLKNERI